SGRRLNVPVAIRYLSGVGTDPGGLAIVDQARSVIQVGPDGTLTPRQVPTSVSWRELGAPGNDAAGHLLVLDSGARRLPEYPLLTQQVVDPPRLLLDDASAQGLPLPFEHAAE